MQEVPATLTEAPGAPNAAEFIALQTGYPYCVFRNYPDDPVEGLAVLSRWPIVSNETIWDHTADLSLCFAIRAVVQSGDTSVGITNVHLDWSSARNRERQVVALLDWLSVIADSNSNELLCGDFNAAPDSSIHRLLTGRQSLQDREANWLDLAEYQEWRSDVPAGATLDFGNNPRWEGTHTLQIPARFDWILLMKKKDYRLPEPLITRVDLFGTQPTPVARLVPSDHYGVAAHIMFQERN